MKDPAIPWSRIAAFVRQYAHDVRNSLHCLDLETALLRELVTDEEANAGVGRIHHHVRSLATQVRSVSSLFQDPQPEMSPTPARAMLRIWRDNHSALPNAPVVQWRDELGEEETSVDVASMGIVFRELLSNASAFSEGAPISIAARSGNGFVIFEMREPKKDPVDTSAWGQPFTSTQRGKYGLGIWTARRLVEANRGTMNQCYGFEDGCLTTQIVLPVL